MLVILPVSTSSPVQMISMRMGLPSGEARLGEAAVGASMAKGGRRVPQRSRHGEAGARGALKWVFKRREAWLRSRAIADHVLDHCDAGRG